MARLMFWLFLIAPIAATDSWIAHYTAEGGGFNTTIRLNNTNFNAGYEVVLTPYAADGTVLSDWTTTLTAQAGHLTSLSREELGWTRLPVSHVKVDAPDAVRVSATWRAISDGAMPADATALTQTATTMRLTAVDGNWFDGLVATNPGVDGAALTISAHDTQGNTLQTTSTTVNGGGKWLAVARSLFDEDQEIAFYEVRSDQPVLFLALRGSLPGSGVDVLTEVRPDTFESAPASLTYANQASRIINRKCSFCHVDGGVAPFPMTNHEQVDLFRDLVIYNIEEGLMPPWKASDSCEEFKGSYAMDATEKDMLLAWLKSGAERGEPAREPAPVEPSPSVWELGEPDFHVVYDEPFDFEAGPDQYKCFPVALNNDEPLNLKAFQFLPGNPEIVHHVLLYVEQTGESERLDANEEGPGYTCFGGPGTVELRLLAGWAPGGTAGTLNDGVGMTIPPNARLIMQVHYHYAGVEGADQTSIGLYFTEEPAEKELLLLPLVNQDFTIPPGEKNYEVTQEITLPGFVSADLHIVAPHMHLLGKEISVELSHPDFGDQCLVDVPKWDFNWQRFYEYVEPVHIPGGSTVKLRCTFDNSEENPFNPVSPPIPVGWGEATTDEMALAFLGVTADIPFGKDGAWEWPLKIQQTEWQREQNKVHSSILKGPKAMCCSPDKDRPWCPSNEKGAGIKPD